MTTDIASSLRDGSRRSDHPLRVIVNLSTMRRGGGLTHVSSFLPELVALRPDITFRALVSERSAELVASWGLEVVAHDVAPRSPRLRLQLDLLTMRRLARSADLMLSPMNHGTLRAGVPQILWACNALYFGGAARSPIDSLNGALARWSMRTSDLVIYPSVTTRMAAESTGVRTPGLVLRHPVADDRPFAPPPRWSAPAPLRVLVPSSNQVHKNLALLPRLSAELNRRGIEHEICVTTDFEGAEAAPNVRIVERFQQDDLLDLRTRYDLVLIPSAIESYSYPLVEFELMGFPVAASDVGAHREIAHRARLFHPASAEAAADAVLAAAADGPPETPPDQEFDSPAFTRPQAYAEVVSAEIDRLVGALR